MKCRWPCLLFCALSLLLTVVDARAESAGNVAEETAATGLESGEETGLAPDVINETTSEFYQENEQLGQIKDITPPECTSPELYAKIRERILAYTEKFNARSTLTKRQKALLLANLGEFVEVSVEDFEPQTDYNTANALIMIKINEKIPAKDIILCRQKQKIETPLYVVLYPRADNYTGYIINLNKNSIDYKDISFIYP